MLSPRARRRAPAIAIVVAVAAASSACADGGRSGASTMSREASATTSPAGSRSSPPGPEAVPSTATASTTARAFATTDAAPAIAPRGTFAVGRRVVTYVDGTRPTPPNGSFAGAPDRTLRTTIWYPARGTPPASAATKSVARDGAPADVIDGPYPLVLFSHGVTALAAIHSDLLSQWASAGYVVVAPDYPLSNHAAPGGPTINDTKNQPADASFVIDQVLANDDRYFGGIVDRDRIGAAGHSLGAITTYGLTYAACCRDERIDAAITLAGAALFVDAPANYFTGAHTPLLAVHGDTDQTVPYALEQQAWQRAGPPKFFVTYRNGNHLQPYLGDVDGRVLAFYEYTTAFFDTYLKDDARGLRRFHAAVRSRANAGELEEQLG